MPVRKIELQMSESERMSMSQYIEDYSLLKVSDALITLKSHFHMYSES